MARKILCFQHFEWARQPANADCVISVASGPRQTAQIMESLLSIAHGPWFRLSTLITVYKWNPKKLQGGYHRPGYGSNGQTVWTWKQEIRSFWIAWNWSTTNNNQQQPVTSATSLQHFSLHFDYNQLRILDCTLELNNIQTFHFSWHIVFFKFTTVKYAIFHNLVNFTRKLMSHIIWLIFYVPFSNSGFSH